MFGACDPARKRSYVLHALLVRTKLKVSFLEAGRRSPLVEVGNSYSSMSSWFVSSHPLQICVLCDGTGSLGRGTPSQSRSGREELGMDSQHGRKLMEYIAFISESLEHEINSMKGRHGGGLGVVEFQKWETEPGVCSSGELILDDSGLYFRGKGWMRYKLCFVKA